MAFADSVKLGLETMIAVSVDDLECDIFLASVVRLFGEVTWVVGSEELRTVNLAGEESRCRLIDLTAFCKSFHVLSTSLFLDLRSFCSSPSEFSEESGGEIIAPVGMTRLLTGGGDWRSDVRDSASRTAVGLPVRMCSGADGSVGEVTEGLRLCLLR